MASSKKLFIFLCVLSTLVLLISSDVSASANQAGIIQLSICAERNLNTSDQVVAYCSTSLNLNKVPVHSKVQQSHLVLKNENGLEISKGKSMETNSLEDGKNEMIGDHHYGKGHYYKRKCHYKFCRKKPCCADEAPNGESKDEEQN